LPYQNSLEQSARLVGLELRLIYLDQALLGPVLRKFQVVVAIIAVHIVAKKDETSGGHPEVKLNLG
jgi:hypothetical protein